MTSKQNKIAFNISTGLMSALVLMSAGVYIFMHEDAKATFSGLGYPSYLIYPLAIAKILGVVAIWSNKSKVLKEWAYAGFFFNFIIALSAHLNVSDGMFMPAIFALLMLFISYFTDKR